MSDAFLPECMDQFDAVTARRVRDLGFTGIFSRFTEHDPTDMRPARCRRVREILDDEGLSMFQATGYRPALVHPDESGRREAVRTLRAALRIARDLGAKSIDTGPGSMSPNGPWSPDPYNYTQRARDQLIRSVREAVGAAEEYGVLICLEGHQLVTLRSAEVMSDVLDQIDSPWVRVDFDPVNWITLETVYESGAAIDAMLDTLRGHVGGSHVKDVMVEDRMVVHLEHCAAGKGILDIGAQLRGIERIDPETPVVTEVATAEELPGVYALLTGLAAENDIEVLR